MSPLRRKLHRIFHILRLEVVNLLDVMFRPVGLSRFQVSAVLAILRHSRLFDAEFYLKQHEDVARAKVNPLRHYVKWGDREGRWPMPLFDPVYYSAQAGLTSADRVNRLLHYACVGRFRGFSPSPWFDVNYYLSHNKDVARSGIDPLLHFVRWGGKEGRDPSPRFDSDYYLSICQEAAEWGINPLIHYLQQGQYEGRSPLPSPEASAFVLLPPQPISPTREDWNLAFAQEKSEVAPLVDVIVPVYEGCAVTLRCLNSVLRAIQRTPYELVVINDASPNQELVSGLERLAGEGGRFTLLHNAENVGFVRSANRGVALHPERDVVLLNSDAEVYGDWLDRLRDASQRSERVGTVTPLSNNATICSYPNFLQDNPYPLEIGYDELDRLAGEVNAGESVEAPTGVGFCLYLTRSCLDDVGVFDDKAFGRGYGEENDFCQRAIQSGWRNLIACDVFVRHWGSASFQGERARLLTEGMKTVKSRYPAYGRDIRRFVNADPLNKARVRLDLARLARLRQPRNVLLVTHTRGGGTERHVLEDAERLRAAGQGAFFMRPGAKKGEVSIGHPSIDALPNLGTLSLRSPATLLELLRQLVICEIHIHHLIDFPRFAATALQEIAAALEVPIRVMVHDYTAICPRVNLVDQTGLYCGEPDEPECNRCIARNGSEFGKVNIAGWRARYRSLFQQAQTVLVPDVDVAVRLTKYFEGVTFTVKPHETPVDSPTPLHHGSLDVGSPLRIAVIGAIGVIKGYDVLLACAKDARKRALPVDFVVFGYTMNDLALKREGVTVTGRYLDHCADQALADLAPHCVWLPYVWPETYSYTLSIALRYGHPIFAFDLGAIASRLHAIGADEYLVPLPLAWDPRALNAQFLAYRETLLARQAGPSIGFVGSGTTHLGQAICPSLAPGNLQDPFTSLSGVASLAVEGSSVPLQGYPVGESHRGI